MSTPAHDTDATQRWRARAQPLVRGFHRYANWLVSISWKRFILLSVLLLVFSGILQNLPPFSWKVTETVTSGPVAKAPKPPVPPAPPKAPKIRIEKSAPAGSAADAGGISISIDEKGVRITPRPH